MVQSSAVRMMGAWLQRVVKATACVIAVLAAGCTSGYWAYNAVGGGTDAAMGEQHDVGYPANDAFLLTQDSLRGDGVLFEVKPDDKLVTLWRDADVPVGLWGGLIGVHPRYRYEIEVIPKGVRRSRIVVNVRAEDIPDEELPNYKATVRLNLFNKIDQLAAKFPPSTGVPNQGGVNFALMPNEDLKALAVRATGNADNWRQIAQDNGLKSPTDTSGLTSVWVRNTMLGRKAVGAPTKGN